MLTAALTACTPRPTAATEFQRLHAQWLVESETIRYSSRTDDYIALPAFRAIVQLGPEVVPVIQDHLESTGCEEDFFLAYALVEINAWESSELWRSVGSGDGGAQGFCRAVLARNRRGGGP